MSTSGMDERERTASGTSKKKGCSQEVNYSPLGLGSETDRRGAG
jgi:hypothetical protein